MPISVFWAQLKSFTLYKYILFSGASPYCTSWMLHFYQSKEALSTNKKGYFMTYLVVILALLWWLELKRQHLRGVSALGQGVVNEIQSLSSRSSNKVWDGLRNTLTTSVSVPRRVRSECHGTHWREMQAIPTDQDNLWHALIIAL